ncbi:MAG TPA: hypothetical protein VGY57_08205 [Vicinamibacterales bacterium]|nr:hypothetical protein [Vicinamibacterales bacterium]
MRRLLAAATCLMMTTTASPAVRGQNDPLAPLRFLVGEWEAVNNPPGESGGFSFTLAVQNRVMMRSNHAVYEATSNRPASRHDDLMVIFSDDGGLKADYFDSEGHVIRYDVSSKRDREVVFHCAPTAKEPGYRLSYILMPEGTLNGQFEVSPPGDREAFKPYLSWTARRVR